MADYISREAAISEIMSEPTDAHYPSWYAEKLKQVPAADVRPVVLCRDCRHRDPEDRKCDSGEMERQPMNEPVQYQHICADCGKKFLGGKNARFCYDCRRRHSGESAKRRRLCDIGAKARWGKHRKGGHGWAQAEVEGKEIGKCEPVN